MTDWKKWREIIGIIGIILTLVVVIVSISQLGISIDTFNQNQKNIKIQNLNSELIKLKSLKSELNQDNIIAETRPDCNYDTAVVDIFLTDAMRGRISFGDINDEKINQGIIDILTDIENIRGIQLIQEKHNIPLCEQLDDTFNMFRQHLNETTKFVDDRIYILKKEIEDLDL